MPRSFCGFRFFQPLFILAVLAIGFGEARAETPSAKAILEATGVQGGFIVHVGCDTGELTAALRANDRFQVHGLDRDSAKIAAARKRLRSQGVYGPVSVDQLSGKELPYVDQLVNLLVAEDLGEIPMSEVMRVLTPRGVAYIQNNGEWTKTVKPVPDNIDEWTHFLHDSKGNAVAQDEVVGPPRHLQWLGSPRWSRHHDRMASLSALVSAKGRIFYVMDEGSRVSIELPPKWMLIARDAFNGVVLWKKPLKDWHSHLYPLKSGPTQLARRLVAKGDRVYITLGYQEPTTALNAATGEEIQTYTQTGTTEELLESDGDLFALVNREKLDLADFKPEFNTGDQRRVREGKQFHWNKKPREVVAVNSETGKMLWSKKTVAAPLSLTVDAKHVVFHDADKVVCLDRKTGEELWSSSPVKHKPDVTTNFGPRMLLYKDVVLFAGGDRNMYAFSSKDGQTLWTAPHAQSGYQSPEDLLVARGLVWNAPTTKTGDSGKLTGRDPRTGEVKVEFPNEVDTYWFHHRCYIAKATENFFMPSRTGVEFVDLKKQNWDIHHWVRGGCLYGVMPANGLLYTPPHDCFCYPEAKLFGFNALAPASDSRQLPKTISEKNRLERGHAFGSILSTATGAGDWPTYRHDGSRSGRNTTPVSADLKPGWTTKLGGRLSAVSIANGKLFVAQVDAHTLHALDEKTGESIWAYTAGGRIDSPPTISDGRALFGSADGWVYCLRADNGELIWRYRAAPQDRRLMSLEQLESVWPVHGTVLVRDGIAWFVAGRSNFLDGGLRLYKLNAKTGEKLAEIAIDEKDPKTGKNIQVRLQTLQMPTGLADILSTDDKYVFMRSQRFDLKGQREDVGPHSGNAPVQGGTQRGDGVHLFSPTGFLDGTYFHRSYWVYGRSFAGGHNGYYQAGKFAPAGRLLAFDESSVYGFGRKPEYLKWTTTMEHQLFATSKEPPNPEVTQATRRGQAKNGQKKTEYNNGNPVNGPSVVRIKNSPSLDPTGKPLTVEAWARSDRPGGVIIARGGPQNGYALVIQKGKPAFLLRSDNKLYTAAGEKRAVNTWVHLVGTLSEDKTLKLYVDGKLVANTPVEKLVAAEPLQATEIAADEGGAVGDYKSPLPFAGVIDEVRVYHLALSAEEVAQRFAKPDAAVRSEALVLACSFNKGKAADASGHKNNGIAVGVSAVQGKVAQGLKFTGQAGRPTRKGNSNRQFAGSLVQRHWNRDIPLMVQAIAIADNTLFVAGPPDVLDEETAFERLRAGDPRIQEALANQSASLSGKRGAKLLAVSLEDGKTLGELTIHNLPVWDGMAIANGRLFMSTTAGEVVCLTPAK